LRATVRGWAAAAVVRELLGEACGHFGRMRLHHIAFVITLDGGAGQGHHVGQSEQDLGLVS
jgi:hypothetical protein